ncbi:glycosyltransferase family 2 protein [Sphingobacterium kyonggiense]
MCYSVSVIIPMFKVQAFVGQCARQLFSQTLQNVEFIFVDDCSPDESSSIVKKVLEDFPARKSQVQIVRHEQNKGLPSARNTGLSLAKGDYIFHCDGDDWLETNALELLWNKAQEEQADLVFCDWYLSFKNNERYMSQDPGTSDLDGLKLIKLMLSGKLKYNVWNKLVKRELYLDHDIRFPDGYGMGEDMTMIRLSAAAKKVSYLPKGLYHYVQLNNEAFTKKPSDKHFEQIRFNVNQTLSYLMDRFGDKLLEDMEFFKLNIKLPFLISSDTFSYKRWNEWYPEANTFIDKNPSFNFRTRFIQKAAMKKQYWLIKGYYYLVIRMVYGLIYR